ncbi:hypothetical protein J113_04140 [Mycobacterium tuberculosis CAS/NITR204]|uniref:FAD-binding domain-containing protein n=1 Tax=Mycobacterium tuberculosis CAS/NITR204 TaxID=1310114 RepID=R4M5I3_MYCTX|nr:hypothetical protein J113_04140 [Mycobacterium tuberculosis CAS/NITR204]
MAGAALAHWLQRTGHTPTVIERAPKFRTGGYMIDFWGVGYQVAKRMGITDQIAAAGYHMEHVRSVGPTGKVKADLGVDVFRRMVGDDFTSLPRGDLAAAIYTTIEDQVETIFDDSIATIDEHRDGVRLTFERTAPRDFDLVIGADGLHSNVRRLVFGPERDFEHYLGCKVAALPCRTPRDERSYVLYNTVDRQLARFALRGDRTMFLFVFRAEHDNPGVAPKDELRDQFGDVGWESRDILAALDDVEDLYFDVVSQIRMDRWSRGRVLLIGDAAGCISCWAPAPAWRRGCRPGSSPAPGATTVAPSTPTRSACVPSSRASKPVRRSSSGFSPPEPDSACGFATLRCAR